MLIKLHEVAGCAWYNLNTRKDYEDGIKFAIDNMPVNYVGTKKECALYLIDKVQIATNNAINNPSLYLGCIALYNAMIKELLTV